MSISIDAETTEVRNAAAALEANQQRMNELTEKMTRDWLALKGYTDIDSRQIGESCKSILGELKRLSPQIESAAHLIRDYANWLEKR